ncbi:hypothetical protein ACFSNO_29750 [Streptomyces cirratus]
MVLTAQTGSGTQYYVVLPDRVAPVSEFTAWLLISAPAATASTCTAGPTRSTCSPSTRTPPRSRATPSGPSARRPRSTGSPRPPARRRAQRCATRSARCCAPSTARATRR